MRGWEEQGKAVNPDRSNVAQEGNPGLPAGSRRGETLKERAFWIQVMEKILEFAHNTEVIKLLIV